MPVSLIGTFGVMYLFDYSLDNLSLMALTIATGFVVDDAIVVIENITRHLEEGMHAAARRPCTGPGNRLYRAVDQRVAGGGVHSDSADGRHRRPVVPRVRGDAVGGHRRLDGRLADDHAHDVRALLKRPRPTERHGWLYRASERFFDVDSQGLRSDARLGAAAISRSRMLVTLATIGFTVYLYVIVPKGFFPQQDTGRLTGTIMADQDTSFQAMSHLLNRFAASGQRRPGCRQA